MLFWNVIFFIILPITAIAFSILLIYNYFVFVDQSTIKIFLPYLLTLKPIFIEKGEIIFISLLDLRNTTKSIQGISILLVSPNNTKTLYTNNAFTNETIYSNPIQIYQKIDTEGNNTIAVINNTNSKVLALNNFIVKSKFIIFTDFLLNRGLGFFIGIIFPIIIIFIQRGLTKKDKNNIRQEQKSQWINNYMKYFIDTANYSAKIFQLFQYTETNQHMENNKYYFNWLYRKDKCVIEKCIEFFTKFYENHQKLRENVNQYYFETLVEEDFISETDFQIRKEIDAIFKPYTFEFYLKKSKYDVDSQNYIFNNILKEKIKQWLENKWRVKSLYKLNLVYYFVIFVAITDIMLVTYKDTNKRRKELEDQLNPFKDELKHYITDLNWEFYGRNKNRYYDLFKRFKPWYKLSIINDV